MTKDELRTLIESMRAIQWEDDDSIREVLSSVAGKAELDSAFRACNNPISEDAKEDIPPNNLIEGYFK